MKSLQKEIEKKLNYPAASGRGIQKSAKYILRRKRRGIEPQGIKLNTNVLNHYIRKMQVKVFIPSFSTVK